jgi:hypothetical protein
MDSNERDPHSVSFHEAPPALSFYEARACCGPLSFSLSTSGKEGMKAKKTSRVYHITLVYENNLTRDVKVRASSREVAEKRALKRNPNAIGIQQRA